MTRWLIDKSALVRLVSSPDAELWLQRAERGLVHIATATLLEVGYSARSKEAYARLILEPPVSAFLPEPMTPSSEHRAVEIQSLLVDHGQHRAPSVPDLLIAALAEVSDLTVLHMDKDYDIIAQITGQAVERLRL